MNIKNTVIYIIIASVSIGLSGNPCNRQGPDLYALRPRASALSDVNNLGFSNRVTSSLLSYYKRYLLWRLGKIEGNKKIPILRANGKWEKIDIPAVSAEYDRRRPVSVGAFNIRKLIRNIERKIGEAGGVSKTSSAGEDILAQAKNALADNEIVKIDELSTYQSYETEADRDAWGIYFATPTLWGLQVVEYIKRNWPQAKICDMGSGNGKFVFLAATKNFPLITGLEARKQLYDFSVENLKQLGLHSTVGFVHIDFLSESEEADLSLYDVIYFFYTFPGHYERGEVFRNKRKKFNSRLLEKLLNDKHGMKQGARLIVLGDHGVLALGGQLLHENIKVGNVPGLSIYTRIKKTVESRPYDQAIYIGSFTNVQNSAHKKNLIDKFVLISA